eukprot:scaffold63711_cov32-Tisochrysis_lutea.AAC.3
MEYCCLNTCASAHLVGPHVRKLVGAIRFGCAVWLTCAIALFPDRIAFSSSWCVLLLFVKQ